MMLSSPAILPPLKKKQCSIAGIGHFYFAHIGHYHFAGTEIITGRSATLENAAKMCYTSLTGCRVLRTPRKGSGIGI
ncbi:MAG: hypothetical protein ABSC55_16300, partial [Syntrophorhabdales bacterium]